MFKKEENNTTDLLKRIAELEVSEKRLIYENNSVTRIKEMDISELQKELSIAKNELYSQTCLNKKRLQEENEQANKRIKSLEFEKENCIKDIELKTENGKLKAELEIAKSENGYLKKLLDTYREMPDVKKIVDNLSGLAVPSIEELKEFAKIVNGSGMKELAEGIKQSQKDAKNIYSELNSLLLRTRGYR